MSDKAFAVLGLFDDADALMAAIPKVREKVSSAGGGLHALPDPRHRGGPRPAPLAPGRHGPGHGLHRRRHGPLLPVVDERRGLPHHHRRQGALLLAGLRAHHVRGHGPLRHLHGGPRHAAPPEQAALLRPPGAPQQGHRRDHAGPVRPRRGGLGGSRWTWRRPGPRSWPRAPLGRGPAPSRHGAEPRPRSSSCAPSSASWWPACVSGLAMYWAIKLFPVLPPMVHMQDQPQARTPSSADAFFRDGHGMQQPVAGTVARGYLPLGVATQEEAAALVNPLPRTAEVLETGRAGYANHCAVCHGPLGNGVPTLTERLRRQAGQPSLPAVQGLPRRQDLLGHREGQERHALLRRRPERGRALGGGPLRARPAARPERPAR